MERQTEADTKRERFTKPTELRIWRKSNNDERSQNTLPTMEGQRGKRVERGRQTSPRQQKIKHKKVQMIEADRHTTT